FELGPIESLSERGLINPFVQKAARWELLDLGRKLDSSSAQVNSLQSELAQRERAYHTVLDHMNDSLLVLDPTKKVVFCNHAFLEGAGMTMEEAIGRSPLEWIEPEDLERVEAIYDSLLSGDEGRATYRFRVRRLNKVVHLESSAMSLIGPSGERLIQSIG